MWRNVFERLLRLRQMCVHWSLCKKGAEKTIKCELQKLTATKKPTASQLQEMLHLMVAAEHTCAYCTKVAGPDRRPVIMPCKHISCRLCIEEASKYLGECPLCNRKQNMSQAIELKVEEMPNTKKGDIDSHSTKTKALLSLVEKSLENHDSKVIIFSQWTSFLDIVSRHLLAANIKTKRIDGTMTTSERDEALACLANENGPVRVMLASLRVAGVGINLTAADTVIMADTCKSFS